MKKIILSILSIGALNLSAQVDCAVDVTINEGATISFCENTPQTLNASDGYDSYSWTGPSTANTQSFTPTSSGVYQVSAVDNVGCTSTASITVTINPTPTDAIASSEGNPICPTGGGTVLSLSGTHNSYSWSNGETSPSITVLTPGTYTVNFTDANSCMGTTTFDLSVITYSLVNNSGSACAGGTNNLVASGGQNYVWSTGDIGPTIEVQPDVTTSYAVTASGPGGSCPQILTIEVSPPSPDDTVFSLPDTVVVQYENSTELIGPSDFSTYLWQPTNQIIDSTSQTLDFTGLHSQWIYLTATHPDGCTIRDSAYMYVLSDKFLPNGFSPNGDGYNDLFVVPDIDSVGGNIIVWNRYGDVVFEQENYQNDWDGTCKTNFCLGNGTLPEGTYFYMITINGIRFKSFLTIKL